MNLKRKEICKRYLENNPEKRKESCKKYREKNKEKIRVYRKKYKDKNREKIQLQNHIYYIENKKRILKRNDEYFKKRRLEDNIFRLRKNVSCIIRYRLKKRLLCKKNNGISFLLYTIDDLIQHLESQFQPWMNWQNYGNRPGKWTIDHIKPDSSFNYISVEDEEFQKCWALKNLRPLEHTENSKKNNKIL